ncbi:MAG: helix-turn-helix transcriptional regulator [Clostridia bacterium]|nr:helix-turn-helix transcriptional regulator [Clostridia bacterium]
MFRYNRITHNQVDLYLKGLYLQPNKTYELSMDIYGGPINIFLTGYNVASGSGSHYVDYAETWTHHTFPFTTACATEDIVSFAEWGIAFVKKPGELLPTDADDTYIDNVRLSCTDDPAVSIITGGDFEAAKNSPVYTRNWQREILGIAGSTYGVDIVTDPCNENNRCLLIPRLSEQTDTLTLPTRVSSFGCVENNEYDITFPKFKNETSHLLLLAVRGTVTVEVEQGRRFTATDGQLVYSPPHESGHFTCAGGQDALYYQLNIFDQTSSAVFPNLGLSELSVHSLKDAAVLGSSIRSMFHYSPHSHTYLHAVNGQFLLLLAEMERQFLTAPAGEKHRPFIEELAEQLRRFPEKTVSTAQKARECGLSECYFITLFKQYMGVSPHRYRLRELINKACALLQSTTMTVQEISYTLGVDDPLYFSRLFRSFRGMSPSQYRKSYHLR